MKLSVGMAIAAAAAVAAVAAVPAGSRTIVATLKLLGRAPVTIQGAHFKPLERIRLTAAAAGRSSARLVRADRRGSFTVRLDLSASRCDGLRIRASRASGAVVALKLPLPACIPETTPRISGG